MNTFKDFINNITTQETTQELNEASLGKTALSLVKQNDVDKILDKDKFFNKLERARKIVEQLVAQDVFLYIKDLQTALAAIEAGADKDKLKDQIQKDYKHLQILLSDVSMKAIDNLGMLIDESARVIFQKTSKLD